MNHYLSSSLYKRHYSYKTESVFIASAFLPWTDENTVTPPQPNSIDLHTQIMTNCPQCTSEIRHSSSDTYQTTRWFITNFLSHKTHTRMSEPYYPSIISDMNNKSRIWRLMEGSLIFHCSGQALECNSRKNLERNHRRHPIKRCHILHTIAIF